VCVCIAYVHGPGILQLDCRRLLVEILNYKMSDSKQVLIFVVVVSSVVVSSLQMYIVLQFSWRESHILFCFED